MPDVGIRLRYRGDFSDEPSFAADDGGLEESQQALSVGVVSWFNGKT